MHIEIKQRMWWVESLGNYGLLYHKRGKIHWVKHPWFQPYEAFCGNTFAIPWPPVFII